MSKKCVAFSKSKLGLETADNRKSFYAGWDAALAEQAEQEPGAWIGKGGFNTCGEGQPLYAAPVRTKDLTDDEIFEAVENIIFDENFDINIARAVIAKFKEKNK